MKQIEYKLIGNNNYFGDLQEEYYKNRGINNYKEFTNLKNHKLVNPLDFNNMQQAINLFLKHDDDSIVGIIVDEDADGYTSASIMYDFINKYLGNKIIPIIHKKNKAHGIILSDFTEEDLKQINLLIVPDAGSNDKKECYELMSKHNFDIIVLDHHVIKEEPECLGYLLDDFIKYKDNFVIVNNQTSNVNKDLTGVGMTYLFIQALTKELLLDIGNKYLDLTMLGLVGDSANTKNLDVQYLLQEGIKNIDNEFLSTMIDSMSYSLKGVVNQESFGWYICPNINAVVRYGDFEQRKLMFEAMAGINTDRVFPYTANRGKNKGVTIDENLYEHVVRFCASLKGKQQREIKKIIEGNTKVKGLSSQIEINNNTKVLVIDATDYLSENSLSGLLANKVSSKYSLPTLVIRKNSNGLYSGSGRGDYIDSFMSKIRQSNIMPVAGHEAAFGIQPFELHSINTIQNNLNEYFKNESICKNIIVDFDIPSSDFVDTMIEDLIQTQDFWGHEMAPPTIRISNIKLNINDINIIGSKSNVLSFNQNYIGYVMFNFKEDDREYLIPWGDTVSYNVIGRPSINEHDGERYCQIIIDNIEVVEQDNAETEKEIEDWSNDFDEEYEW